MGGQSVGGTTFMISNLLIQSGSGLSHSALLAR
jgi:hypothetical protein